MGEAGLAEEEHPGGFVVAGLGGGEVVLGAQKCGGGLSAVSGDRQRAGVDDAEQGSFAWRGGGWNGRCGDLC